MSKVNIVIIGLGYHAKRIYLDFYKRNNGTNLVGVVDLASQESAIKAYLQEKEIDVKTLFLKDGPTSDSLDRESRARLDAFYKECACDAVIISTEPLSHYKYVTWALKRGLHILLDKPITTEVNVSTDIWKARKLYSDYLKIEKLYRETLAKKNTVFILQAQRRFHNGFLLAKEKIREMLKRTNCQVTSIQSFHSDGQWRLPDEIVDIDYHSYNQNYGKMSHSGYHSLDISLWLCADNGSHAKKHHSFEVYSKFNRPFDFLHQILPDDYAKVFGNFKIRSNADSLRNELKIEGEIDSFNSISLLNKGGALITHLTCNAVHNGFSQRGSFEPNLKNLYKGNGRVRQESYIVEQGPFQCIIINSFQSSEILKGSGDLTLVGGEHHFDVHVFRNSSLFKQDKSYELFQLKDSISGVKDQYSRGHNEDARRSCITEFIESIKENRAPNEQKSNFFEHKLSTRILSSVYESGVKDLNRKNNVIRSNL